MPAPPLSKEDAQAAVNALREAGGVKADAARILGIPVNTYRSRLDKAAQYGLYKPGEILAEPPIGLSTVGVSTLYDADGNIRAQWHKTKADEDARERAIAALIEALKQDVPRAKPLKAPTHTEDQLCNVYTVTDLHLGMLAWHRETGANWDLEIGERVVSGCFATMLDRAPKASMGVIAILGDFLHYDGEGAFAAKTPVSKHDLDADGRFHKLPQTAYRVLIRIIDAALKKHDTVYVLIAEGNHDMKSSVWLQAGISCRYENEPRLEVEDSPFPYYAFEWGLTSFYWHHSHLSKMTQLPMVFAAEFPEIWGRTKYRYGFTGDKHHREKVSVQTLKERAGIVIEQHPTLATRDAYAARLGLDAIRAAKVQTFHKKFGMVAEFTVTPEMLEDAA